MTIICSQESIRRVFSCRNKIVWISCGVLFRMQEVNKHLYVSLYYFSWLYIVLTYDLNDDNVISMVECNLDFWGGRGNFPEGKEVVELGKFG